MKRDFVKVVCVNVDPMETEILDDVNKPGRDEACEYIQHQPVHPTALWIMVPMSVGM